MKPTPQKPRTAKSIAGCLITVLFCAAVIASARHTPFFFDHAANIMVAKNLVNGYGWMLTYHQPELALYISSGPTIVLPAALMMLFLGNPIWLPAACMALLTALLSCLLAWQWYKAEPDTHIYIGIITGAFFYLLFIDNIWLTSFVGDIPALLLLLIASAVALRADIHSEYRRCLVIGVLAGLSFLARMTSLPGFAAIGLYLILKEPGLLRQGWCGYRELLRRLGCGLIGLGLIALPYQAYIFYQVSILPDLSIDDYLAIKSGLFRTNRAIGLGFVLHADHPLELCLNNIRGNSQLLWRLLGQYGLLTALPLSMLLAVMAMTFQKSRRDRVINGMIVLQSLMLALYALWFFPLASIYGFSRYALYPLLLVALWTCFISARAWGIAGVAVLVVGTFVSAQEIPRTLFKEIISFQKVSWLRVAVPDGSADHYHQEAKAVVDFIQSQRFRYPLATCGFATATLELEYLLPQSGNFLDCYRVIGDALALDNDPHPSAPDTTDSPQAAQYHWTHPVNFTLVINRGTWKFLETTKQEIFRHRLLEQACGANILYNTDYYLILECRYKELENTLPLGMNNPFAGSKSAFSPPARK